MPKPPSVERVKKLAQQLTPEERKLLFNFLPGLPDSGIQTGSLDPPSPLLSPEDKRKVEESATTDNALIISSATHATIFMKGRAMFQLFFYPDYYRQSRMEMPSWKDAPASEKVREQIKAIYRLHGKPEPSEEDIVAATKQTHLDIYQVKMERVAKELSARLPHMVMLLFDAGTKIVELGIDNDFAGQTSQRKKTLEEMVMELEPFWRQIKAHLNVTPGGRRNVKHEWSVVDHACLMVNHDRLKPIWRDAKKAAKQALEAKDPARRKNWKETVDAAYKDYELPSDLIEQLKPNLGVQPADLALIHAGRICIPVTLSLKTLKEQLRHFKRGARSSPASDQNEGSS